MRAFHLETELGQCKARPFNVDGVCFLFFVCFSAPTHAYGICMTFVLSWASALCSNSTDHRQHLLANVTYIVYFKSLLTFRKWSYCVGFPCLENDWAQWDHIIFWKTRYCFIKMKAQNTKIHELFISLCRQLYLFLCLNFNKMTAF